MNNFMGNEKDEEMFDGPPRNGMGKGNPFAMDDEELKMGEMPPKMEKKESEVVDAG
jgi:hypothetical protein